MSYFWVIGRMTSGVVYSIVMHILLITSYTLLILQIFYTRGFDLDRFIIVFGYFYLYLMLGLGEIAVRASIDHPIGVTMFGHLNHLAGCILLSPYMVILNPILAFAFGFLRVLFLFWCVFVSYSTCIPDLLGDDSLTQPLV